MKQKKQENFYEKNMTALKEVATLFANWINEEKDKKENNWIRVIRADNGDYNAIVYQGLQTLPMYSMANPRREAKKKLEGKKFNDNEVTVLCGIGLGHALKALLLKKQQEHHVIVVEPNAKLLAAAFSIYDFSTWISKYRLHFAVTKDDFTVFTSLLYNDVVVQKWELLVEGYTFMKAAIYHDLLTSVTEHINSVSCNMGTVMGAGSHLALNDIENFPYIIRHRGIDELKDLFKGKPAVIVSTGPSLQKNIHLLREAQGNVIIIAVAQALRLLLAYDIRPDFICTVDYGEVNYGHFVGLFHSDVPLIALNKTYAPIIKEWKGTKFITSSPVPGYEETALQFIAEKGSVEQGGSVSHSCVGSAMKMGCFPIILIGQDLSLTDKSHFTQADENGRVFVDKEGMLQWEVTDPKSSLYGGTYGMGPAISIPGYFGETVLTNMGLMSFITNFSNTALGNKDNFLFLNCTEGGAKIDNFKQMSLKSALKLHCMEKIDKTILNPFLSLTENYMEKIKKAFTLLKKDIPLLQGIVDDAQKGLEIKEQLEDETITDKKKEELLRENAIYSKKAEEAAKKNALIQLYIYNESVTIHNQTLKVKGKMEHLLTNKKDLDTRIERNRIILKAAKGGAEKLIEEYNKTIQTLETYYTTKDESILSEHHKDEDPDLDSAEKLFSSGNFARPLLEARRVLEKDPTNEKAKEIEQKALQIREEKIKEAEAIVSRQDEIEYNSLVEESQKLVREKKGEESYKKALELLEKATKLQPERWEARWGFATTLFYNERFEEAITIYDSLIEESPKVNHFKFEKALVLLRMARIQDALQILGNLIEITHDYDGFLAKVGDLYLAANMEEQARIAYENYTERFPTDIEGWMKLHQCYEHLGMEKEAWRARQKVQRLDAVLL